jgi:N utilization substance protein A
LDVLHESRGPQIILSRTHPNFLIHLFHTEVPEIAEGIVTIIGAAREPGIRAKFAVASNNSDIDPVGACVGMKGSRVQTVVQELRGEKIDIIPWHLDPAKFVCNALAPAEISRVIIDEDNQSMEVIVPDEFLSIAIGKKGQNVRLASKLTGWHLDVKSETKYSIAMQSGYDSLIALPGIGISMADALYELGFYSAEEVSNATPEDLIQIRGIGEETAKKLIAAAQTAVLEAQQAEDIEEEEAQEVDASETDGSESDKTDAEKDPAPSEGEPESDQTEPADGDEPENAKTDTDEAVEQSEDEPENAKTDTDEAAEQSEDEPENAKTDTDEAAEQSEDEPENAKTDTDETAEQSEDEPENAKTDTEN